MMRDMKIKLQKGSSLIEPILILAALCIIIFIFVLPASKLGPTRGNFSFGAGYYSPNLKTSTKTNEDSNPIKNSSYSNSISLSGGNASYSIQPYTEYISIGNNGSNPINITGWSLKNAKNERPYAVGGNLQRFPADIVLIPQAVTFISSNNNNIFQDVVLNKGEKAIITTGSIGVKSPYAIVSFKENKCSKYLENLPEYKFTPPLSSSCTRPSREPGVNNLDVPCQKYLNSMRSCHTPKFNTVDKDGNVCSNCVDDNPTLSGSCVAFIKAHFNYSGCIASHQSDPDFSGKTWRIFLSHPWELWADSHETISLFDSSGTLVDYKSY